MSTPTPEASRFWAVGGGGAAPRFAIFDHETSLASAAALLASILWIGARLARSTTANKASSSRDRPARRSGIGAAAFVAQLLLLALATELPVYLATPRGLADLIVGTDPLLGEILRRVPSIARGPNPPLLLRNRHVQFLPWLIQNEVHKLRGGIPFQRLEVEVRDCADKATGRSGGNGTIECERRDRMDDAVTLDVFPPFDPDSPHGRYAEGFNASSPVILYAPGLRCDSQDLPGNAVIRKAYEAGFRSVVINRRGHTPNRPLKSPRWNLFGDVDDMEQVYWHVKRELVAEGTPFFLYGVSSGTAVTVSGLSKWDKRRAERPEEDAPSFVASVDVSPGYDISKMLSPDRFLWPYHDLLIRGVKNHFVLRNEELLRSHDSNAVDRILNATSMQSIVDHASAFAGYSDAASYYEDTNPINEVRDIATPKLVLNAADDPCCNVNNLYETSPYPRHGGKTYAEMIEETERGMVAVTYTGSHCPFLCGGDSRWTPWMPLARDPLTGGWMLRSWADEVTVEYFRAALEVYGDRRFL
ncbi:hypothetical protein ACHAWF_005638 [Thalassiosira exigua]